MWWKLEMKLLLEIVEWVRARAGVIWRAVAPHAGPSVAGGAAADFGRSGRELVLENAMLRYQVVILRRKSPHPRFTTFDRLRLLLVGAVCRVFADSVLGWYRRRMAAYGVKDGQGGAVLALQRASADLRLNPHIHGIFLDGVFVSDDDGVPAFRPLPRLRTDEVADLLQIIRARVLRFLARRGVVDVSDDATVVPDELADKEPVLAQLAAAAVSGLPPAGPERRRPIVIALPGRPGVEIQAPLSVAELGFSLEHGREIIAT
jgi:hypothetical protein